MLKRAALLCALLLGCAFALGACGDDSDDGSSTGADGTGTCEEVEAPAPKDGLKLKAPTDTAPTATGVTFETSCGSFTVTFDDRAPKTAASFQYLAEEGFYDDTVFHRVAPGFLIQGGDPLGSSEDPTEVGIGGPGYTIDEEPPSDLSYTRGTVAMAKTAVEPPGRSGSQFYVVTAADAGLPPDYALAGEVSEGIETIEAIEALGPPGADGAPSMPVVIDSATPVGG